MGATSYPCTPVLLEEGLRTIAIIIVSLVVAIPGAIGTALCRCADGSLTREPGLFTTCFPWIPVGAGDEQAGCSCSQTDSGCHDSADLPVVQARGRDAAPIRASASPVDAPTILSAALASSALVSRPRAFSPLSLACFALLALRTVALRI